MAWLEVKRSNPCPICAKIDWCSVSDDGFWSICRRLDTGTGKYKVDKTGADYWIYQLTDLPDKYTMPEYKIIKPSGKHLDPTTLDQVHRELLNLLSLSGDHQENLTKRGLTSDQIELRGYKTLPLSGRSRLAKKLVNKFEEDTCASVPGLYLKEEDGKQWWSLAGAPGILIPVRDHVGRVVALKVRRDKPGDGAKYLYVSSKKYGGPGTGSPIHIPLYNGSIDIVRLTEGELKGDIATALTGMLTISIPGVSAWRPALPVLKSMGVKIVRVAFDADARKNPNVARALSNTVAALTEEGFTVELEQWPEEQGKGIDDLLVAGGAPQVLADSQKVTQAVKGIVDAAQEVTKTDQETGLQEARIKINKIIVKLKEKKNPVVFFNNIDAQKAVGMLPAAEQSIFWTHAKEACPRLNLLDARRAVKEACGEAKKKRVSAASQGLTQRNGAYWVEKMTQEGPVPVPISNFVLDPRLKLYMPDNKEEVLSVDVYVNSDNKHFPRILKATDLLGRRELLKAIGSVSAQWTGSDTDVQQLVGYMANQDPPTKKGVPFIGHFEGRFVTPNAVLTANGLEEDSDYVYVPQKVAFEDYVKFPQCDNWSALAREIFKRLISTQSSNVILPLIGWFFMCPAAPILRKKWNEFPILHAWGTGGGGKTSIIQLFLNLMGVTADPFSCSMKQFALIKMLSCTNSLPVFLDEYRPHHMDQKQLKSFHEKLLLIYKSSKESRGKPDQTTVEYPLMAPVIIAGEAPLPEAETGLQERVLQIRFNRNFLNEHPEAEKNFNELMELPLGEFAAGYVTWLMKQDVMDSLNTAIKLINKAIAGMVVSMRVKHNLAVMLNGILIFEKLAKELGVKLPNIYDFTPTLRQLAGETIGETFEPKNAVDRFMLHLEAMAHSGEIRQGVDYVLDEEIFKGTATLYVYTNVAIATHAKWCKVRGLEHEMINDRSLKIMMLENPGKYVLTATGYRKRIGNSNLRCTVIDATELEKALGISLDTWRDTEQRNTAMPPKN